MLPSEKSRNFELKGQIEEGKRLLSEKLERLFSEPWQDHRKVSLRALEDLIQVRHPPDDETIHHSNKRVFANCQEVARKSPDQACGVWAFLQSDA
jgi:hypothetical protein